MKFLQISDAHLDSNPGASLGLDESKKRVLISDIRRAFERACEIARAEQVDVVLAPGDLFDYETADYRTADFIAQSFASLSPVPVVIAPGNHDGLRPRSPYIDPSRNWPGNVTIFREPHFETVHFDNVGLSVTGLACVGKGSNDRLLSSRVDHDSSATSILLFHGSRDGFRPCEKPGVLPFSDAELESQGADYAAIGHFHSHSEILAPGGAIIGAYSGCIQGRAMDELGEKGVIVGEIAPGGRAVLTRRMVAVRAIRIVEVDVTGSTGTSDICTKIEQTLNGATCADDDILQLRLLGGVCEQINPDAIRMEAFSKLFHVSVDCSGLMPDYDLDAIALESRSSGLEAAFVRRLRTQMLALPEDEQQVYRDAIYYGIDALRGRVLRPRHED